MRLCLAFRPVIVCYWSRRNPEGSGVGDAPTKSFSFSYLSPRTQNEFFDRKIWAFGLGACPCVVIFPENTTRRKTHGEKSQWAKLHTGYCSVNKTLRKLRIRNSTQGPFCDLCRSDPESNDPTTDATLVEEDIEHAFFCPAPKRKNARNLMVNRYCCLGSLFFGVAFGIFEFFLTPLFDSLFRTDTLGFWNPRRYKNSKFTT